MVLIVCMLFKNLQGEAKLLWACLNHGPWTASVPSALVCEVIDLMTLDVL